MITKPHVQKQRDYRSEQGSRRISRASLIALSIVILLAGILDASAQALEDFGYNRIEAKGGRPLLIILTEFAGSPALRDNAASYFGALAFNTFAPASNPSLKTYYTEISNGRFFWERAGVGVVGPYSFTKDDIGTETDGKLTRITLALKAAANDGFNFAQFDENGDQTITTNELGILIIDNLPWKNGPALAGANRASDPACFKLDGSTTNLCLRGVVAGQDASFMTLAHELLHSLGITAAGDIYGSNDNSQGYTTMGATIYNNVDDRRTYHLDPFHKMQLGWVEPKMHSVHVPGTETIGAAQLVQDDQPVILYSPFDLHEFFMLEYRTTTAAGGAGYDADLPSNGLVIWHVRVDDNKVPVNIPSLVSATYLDPAVFILGAPNMARGHGTAWTVGDSFLVKYQIIPYPLTWLSGVSTGVKIKVGATSDAGSKLTVWWGNFSETPPPPKKKIVYYSQNYYTGAVGQFDENGNHQTLSSFTAGAWTHVVSDAGGIFYYNRGTRMAMLASVDAMGNHKVLRGFPPGYFGTGWTHIVSYRGYLFFYNSGNGAAAIGTISANGFHQYKSYAPYSFGTGWTHIVSTQNGLLFYSKYNGAGAVGDWQYIYTSPCTGCFQAISEVRFKQLSGFQAGSFTTGWTSIVETGNGVLFYRLADGLNVMVDIDTKGGVSTRSGTVQYLKAGYTAVVAAGDDILFYDAATGNAALAGVVKFSPWVIFSQVGTLSIRQEFPAYFSPGWSDLVVTADPPTL